MNSSQAYRALSGVFCVYKPTGMSMERMVAVLKQKLCKDLNQMPDRPLKRRLVYSDSIDPNTNLPIVTTVPDLADHPLVAGERFLRRDLMIGHADIPSDFTSGVTVVNINGDFARLKKLSQSGHIKVYHVTGEFGLASLDYTYKGKIVERTTCRHVKIEKIERALAGLQSSHQRYMFELAQIDLQSQEAYELAAKGLVRPNIGPKSNPIIYGIKCIDFKPPVFTLEIHCVNENCEYLLKLIHNLGLELRTNALCRQLRRIRYGHFTLSHSLLQKHWQVQPVLENLIMCKPLLSDEKLLKEGNIREVRSLQSGLSASKQLVSRSNETGLIPSDEDFDDDESLDSGLEEIKSLLPDDPTELPNDPKTHNEIESMKYTRA